MCLAIPGEVVDLHERDGLRFAKVRFGGVVREVCLAYEPDATLGEFVLVHVGFAIGKIDREAAAQVWELLESIGETQEVMEPDGIPE
jgi:hydrogenase expression/formation protein HypC